MYGAVALPTLTGDGVILQHDKYVFLWAKLQCKRLQLEDNGERIESSSPFCSYYGTPRRIHLLVTYKFDKVRIFALF